MAGLTRLCFLTAVLGGLFYIADEAEGSGNTGSWVAGGNVEEHFLRGQQPGTKPWAARGADRYSTAHSCGSPALSESQLQAKLQRRCRVLCEREGEAKDCSALLESCVGAHKVRHAQKLQALPSALPADHETAPVTQVAPEDITFVVFFAVGKRNGEAYPHHQYLQPDMNFAEVLRITHPGSRIVMLSDEHTPFAPDLGIDVFRVPMDSERMGRNAYANYYQYIGQKAFLESLKANASTQHVVFMDMDVLVLEPILELFCAGYGYGLTINANDFDPVDIGVQFVQASHYDEGIAFLQELTDRYLNLIGHPNSFTTGQVVMRNTLEMGHRDAAIPVIATAATKNNMHCRTVQGGKHRICFFPCLRYNFWEDCTATTGQPVSQDPAVFREHGVKIMQFVAWRKPGLEVVAEAFLAEGLEGAYRAFAALPHTEAGYNERFKFNAEVTKICYKDDVLCAGVRFEDEPLLFSKPPPKLQ